MNRLLSLLAVVVALPVHAEIFRCREAGTVTYQELPCSASATGGATGIPSSFPEANVAERERLLRREAALDARLVERERIASAERIARAEIAMREKEAQAAREAAAAAQQAAPLILVPVYYRPFPHPRYRPHRLGG